MSLDDIVLDACERLNSNTIALATSNHKRMLDGYRIRQMANSDAISDRSLIYHKLEENAPSRWRAFLYEDSFKNDKNRASVERWRLFWMMHCAIGDMIQFLGRHDLYEEVQTAGLFGHLASIMRIFSILEPESSDDYGLFWADFAHHNMEKHLGSDFALAIPLDEDRIKIAMFQAKKSSKIGDASVRRPDKRAEKQQMWRLYRQERRFIDPTSVKSDHFRDCWCYYCFWHEPDGDAVMLPTIRSVVSVKNDVEWKLNPDKRLRRSMAERWRVNSLVSTIDFASFVSLFLAEENENVGIILSREEAATLFDAKGKKPFIPSQVVGISLPGSGWRMGYWWEMLDRLRPTNVIALNGSQMISEQDAKDELAFIRSITP